MKKIFIYVLFFAPVLLTGCKSLYGKYERPEVETDGLVRDVLSTTDTLMADGGSSFGLLPWREVFTDPQLQFLIEQGLERNSDLLNAALNIKMVEAQLNAAKLAFIPGFTFSPQGTIASWDGSKPAKTYSLPLTATWSIDLFGNLLSQKRSVQMQLLQMKDYQTAVKTSIVANVANMYYTLLMLDAQLKVVEDMEQLTKETWEIMQLRKNTTIGIRSTAVQSAEANYYSVKTQKTDLINFTPMAALSTGGLVRIGVLFPPKIASIRNVVVIENGTLTDSTIFITPSLRFGSSIEIVYIPGPG